MFIRTDMVHGLSHDVVICFQEDNPEIFEHNVCMRARAVLIVVYIPEKAYKRICFCKICPSPELPTEENDMPSVRIGPNPEQINEGYEMPTCVTIGPNGQPIYGKEGQNEKKNKKGKKRTKKR